MEMLSQVVTYLRAQVENLIKVQSGQTIVEYFLVIVFIALAVFFLSPSFTSAVVGTFSRTSSVISSP